MEKNILLCVEYDGTRYSGWQRQGNTDNTIEKKLTDCIRIMSGCRKTVELHGSGRTDGGVHARGQMANFKLDTSMEPEEIMNYINSYLPEDIRVRSAKLVDDSFHARLSAKGKVYAYSLDVGSKADVFLRKYAWHIEDKLDIELMREGATLLVGEKDFRSLSDMKTKKSSIRILNSVDIIEKNPVESDIITIRFTGNGFLYHQVRKLTALLVEIGTGRLKPCVVEEILDKKDRQAFKLLAPAKGLCLEEVFYETKGP